MLICVYLTTISISCSDFSKKKRRQWIRCVVWCIKRLNHDEPIFIFLHGVTFGSFEARCFSTTRRKDPRRVNRIVIQWDEWKHHQWHPSYCSKSLSPPLPLFLQHSPSRSHFKHRVLYLNFELFGHLMCIDSKTLNRKCHL